MKTLDELLACVRDEARRTQDKYIITVPAHEWTIPSMKTSLILDGYRAGHAAACDVLIPALEEAIEKIECAHTSTFHAECKTADKDEILDYLDEALDNIRALLKTKETNE